MQAVAALQFRVGIHIHDLHRRQGFLAPQGCDLRDHLVAQFAVPAVHDGQKHRYFCPRASPRDWCMSPSTMYRTVCGGTSPKAMNLCPDWTCVMAEEEPTCASAA